MYNTFCTVCWFSSEHAGERIPTLNEGLDLCEELDLLLFLELKGGSSDSVMLSALLEEGYVSLPPPPPPPS